MSSPCCNSLVFSYLILSLLLYSVGRSTSTWSSVSSKELAKRDGVVYSFIFIPSEKTVTCDHQHGGIVSSFRRVRNFCDWRKGELCRNLFHSLCLGNSTHVDLWLLGFGGRANELVSYSCHLLAWFPVMFSLSSPCLSGQISNVSLLCWLLVLCLLKGRASKSRASFIQLASLWWSARWLGFLFQPSWRARFVMLVVVVVVVELWIERASDWSTLQRHRHRLHHRYISRNLWRLARLELLAAGSRYTARQWVVEASYKWSLLGGMNFVISECLSWFEHTPTGRAYQLLSRTSFTFPFSYFFGERVGLFIFGDDDNNILSFIQVIFFLAFSDATKRSGRLFRSSFYFISIHSPVELLFPVRLTKWVDYIWNSISFRRLLRPVEQFLQFVFPNLKFVSSSSVDGRFFK